MPPSLAQDSRSPIILDSSVNYGETVGDGFLRYTQEVPDDFLKGLREDRDDSVRRRAGDYMAVATVPTAVYALWMRQGHDPYRWSAKELLAKLRQDGLDAFIQTNKSL